MEYIKTFLTALLSITTLFLIAKLIGARQLSQLSLFDYINGITIGSIAAELSTSSGKDTIKCLIAAVTYGTAAFILSYLTDKSLKVRRFVTGKPTILMKNGKMYDKNFAKVKIDINEFQEQCRTNGYFDLKQIDTAILEANGRMSVLPKSKERPATAAEMNIEVKQEEIPSNIILDGELMKENLKATGYDEKWLKNELRSCGINNIKDVFIATCTKSGSFTAFERNEKVPDDTLI